MRQTVPSRTIVVSPERFPSQGRSWTNTSSRSTGVPISSRTAPRVSSTRNRSNSGSSRDPIAIAPSLTCVLSMSQSDADPADRATHRLAPQSGM